MSAIPESKPLSPPFGLAISSFTGLHAKSKFQAASLNASALERPTRNSAMKSSFLRASPNCMSEPTSHEQNQPQVPATLQVVGGPEAAPARIKQGYKLSSLSWAKTFLCLLMACSGLFSQQLLAQAAASPIVFRVTDAVKPGELLTVYGEGLTPDGIQVAVDATPAWRPTETAITLDIVQTDPEGHFAIAHLPVDMQAGGYNVWVKNRAGWSNPIKLNAARPQWLSIDRIAAGLKVKVVGRNLDGLEFKANRDTRVKLVAKQKPRAFRDDQGRRIVAELIAFENEQVSIRREGRLFKLPLSRFSAEDRKFIEDWAARRAVGNADGEYEAAILDMNPYAVVFTVTEAVPHATYDVLVSNDGGKVWRGLESDQMLGVGPKIDDPLGLGVFWAGDFNWSRRINVRDHSAIGDGKADDTVAIQAAIDAVKKAGGGGVYFPNGNYKATEIRLPAGVVLLGESRENTVLSFAGTTNINFIQCKNDGSKNGRIGIANLKIGIDMNNPNQVFPNFFIWFGTGNTADRIFLKSINIDYPFVKRPNKGNAILISAEKYVLMNGVNAKGYGPYTLGSINRYSEFSDGDYLMGQLGVVAITENMYTVIERNRIAHVDPDNVIGNSRGIETISYSYVAENHIENSATRNNASEQVMLEPRKGYQKMYGAVTSATSNTVTVNPRQENDGKLWGDATYGANSTWDVSVANAAYPTGWYISIIDGRGLGQYRKLVSGNGTTFTIEKPWDAIPDSTSKFLVFLPAVNSVIYKNTMKTATNAILLYNNALDVVVADNVSDDTLGVVLDVFNIGLKADDVKHCIGFFNRFSRNTVTGSSVARRRGAGIGVLYQINNGWATNSNTVIYAYGIYGLDIKDNYVRNTPFGDGLIPNGIYVKAFALSRGVPKNRHAIKGVVIENNITRDSNDGITIGGPEPARGASSDGASLSYGIVVKDNMSMNTRSTYVDSGSKDPVFVNNRKINDETPPVSTARISGLQKGGSYSGSATVALSASDDVAGVRLTEYSLDAGVTWKRYEVPVVFDQQGSFAISYRSIDRVENLEQTKSLNFIVGPG